MTTCPGCNLPLEPIAQIRTYHTQCDPQGRVDMLERVLRLARDYVETCLDDLSGEPSEDEVADDLMQIDTALAYRPAQMKERGDDQS